MKKILYFTFALVASTLAFTSCESNKIDSPLVGTWRYQSDPAPDSGWFCVYKVTFNGDGTFAYYDFAFAGEQATEEYDGFVWRGSYEIKEDIATVHFEKYGMAESNGKETFDDEFEPYDEQMKFRIEGNKLHLTREYGTDYAWTATYTKQ